MASFKYLVASTICLSNAMGGEGGWVGWRGDFIYYY
jgi:hypothetical protein